MDIRAHTSSSRIGPWHSLETLEARVLLDGTPMPDLALLDNPDNTVIRIATEFGDVDIELLASDAPLAALNFLEHTQAGDYGETFVHYADDFVLGAGLYRINDQTELHRRFSPSFIDTTFVHSNIAQTLAMPVFDATTGESNGSFIINLEDNSLTRDGSWVVFARIVQGFDAIEQIAAQPTLDLSQAFPNEPTARWLSSTPVATSDPAPSTLDNSLVSNFESVSVIKQSGSSEFLTYRIYYPEGYSWERVFESVHLANPGETSLDYQVMVRYEVGQRDQTIATGSLAGQDRMDLVVSEADQPSTLVRNSVPYAYEIWSTAPIAATLRHDDFRGVSTDAFYNPDAVGSAIDHTVWSFSQVGLETSASRSFLLWQNVSDQAADVEITFYYEDRAPEIMNRTLGAHRRDGLDLSLVAQFDDAAFIGATVRATQNIVANLTRYDLREAGVEARLHDDSLHAAIAQLGTPGGGATAGVTPGYTRGGLDAIAILNTGQADANITFTIIQNNVVETVTAVVTPGRLLVLEGEASPLSVAQHGQEFTLRYDADIPVTVATLTTGFRGTSPPFAIFASTATHFAEARVIVTPSGSPSGQQALWLYNPSGSQSTATITFDFGVGGTATIHDLILEPGHGEFIRLTQLDQFGVEGEYELILTEPYAVSVESMTPFVVQAIQFSDDGVSEIGTLASETAVLIDDPSLS